MDGLIVSRSVTLSNHIAVTQLPEGVVASYYRALMGVAAIALSHLRKSEGYKEPALVKGIEGSIYKRNFQRTPKTIIKYYSEFYLLSQLSHYSFTSQIRQRMSGRRLTQSEHAIQQVVVLVGELLSQLAEAGLTHTYQDVFRFCEFEDIDYLVLRYLNTGQPPYEEWAEEWLHEGEV